MSDSLPPFPQPQRGAGEHLLLELGPGVGPEAVAEAGADEPCLRADAARNRARLLEAAARLVEQFGAAGVTMEAVAAAAQVGKGTVFRRFGDRTGLLMALLDHSERKLQAAFLTGSPPLGPGAPPVERLRAFGVAVLRRAVDELELQLAAEGEPGRRFASAPRMVLSAHVTMLLRQAIPGADCELLAKTLMGYLDPALIHHLTKQCGMPPTRLEAGWIDLVDRITGATPSC
ncbi:TetR/AcrR family transcriptional regulator [Streptomyces sp. SID12488]|uniref:TetR/AcrR family transcriptional regulator n=1 Tax=Streptomyces sp. SID12488 TaxID=2706040 RepID=UPI0013D9B9D2|nr:TetR/AcrR family transcriptional regulator [Streptomyces sp. SID12488]NEA66419.1 TetR/AcrR family transcriptional regulator [Streptomyces sp. SID12488]